MRRFTFIIAILVCSGASVAIAFADKQTPLILETQSPSVPDNVKVSIRSRVDHDYYVGIVVGIVTPNETQYYSYGKTAISGNEKPNKNTVFEIGSVTKVFTTLLLADMVERGKIAFDDPIEKYLPSSVKAPRRKGKSITLAHLATHTSGLPRYPKNMNVIDPCNPLTVEQMYDFLSSYTLQRDIGEKYVYSNYGMGLLGHILELHSGMSYEELVEQRIVNELGIDDTRITLSAEMKTRLAKGHRNNIEAPSLNLKAIAGAGALRSTAEDMLTFLAANMGLKSSRLYSAMKTTHESHYEIDAPTAKLGYAWRLHTINDRDIIWHSGGTGGYSSFAGFSRGQQKGVVVLTNTAYNSVIDIGFHLLQPAHPLRQLYPNTPSSEMQIKKVIPKTLESSSSKKKE